jgi:hypothetical protein
MATPAGFGNGAGENRPKIDLARRRGKPYIGGTIQPGTIRA